jgi:DNA mismatch endonuclease, patch repair protein
MDNMTKIQRSKTMSAVRSTNTKGEIEIRKRLHHMGLRYRLHQNKLPGKPDIVFRSYRVVIFIHGCFWHQHACGRAKLPKTNRLWWKEKLFNNRKRDENVFSELLDKNWRILIIWECAFRGAGKDLSAEFDKIASESYFFIKSNISNMIIDSTHIFATSNGAT